MKHLSLLVFILICIVDVISYGQRVTISKELSIHSDIAYDVIGNIEENILLYRDKGNERVVEVFDRNLKYLFDREIDLEHRRSDVYAIIPQDTCFSIIFGYRKKRKYYLQAHKYNMYGRLIDSTRYLDGIKDFKLESFKYIVSEDKSKTLLFTTRKSNLFYSYVIDNNTMEVLWRKESKFIGIGVREDFRTISVSNRGEVSILFEIDNIERKREKHYLMLIGLDSGDGQYENKFLFENKITVGLKMEFDNHNRRIILAGLVSEGDKFNASGYFHFTYPIDHLNAVTQLEDTDFEISFLKQLYGKKVKKDKTLNDNIIRNILLREDGVFLLITEMHKEFHRRSAFNGGARSPGGFYNAGNGWIDYYNNDIAIFAINPDGTEHWKKILYKKQFSQDDDGSFSSFFVFKTPSRLRLIYNDEIKRNNTVSEYVMDPLGNFERNSLLSTEYQKLKLRFRDAVQISSDILLVPSERNAKLSLVKIDYSE